MSGRILVVSENADVARIWAYTLHLRGYRVTTCHSAPDALRLAGKEEPDLVILDQTPVLDALTLCSDLRKHGIGPVLLLSLHAGECELLAGYECGADECIVKPVSPLLLLAKVQSWLRLSWTIPANALETVTAGNVSLLPERRELVIEGRKPIRLTNLELRLLQALMSRPLQVLNPDQLIDRVWGADGGDAAMLKNLVYRLRRKIEAAGEGQQYIVTVAGQGYRFQLP